MKINSNQPDNLAVGIAWMLATMCLFTSMDTVAKYLTQSFAIQQIIWARFTFHVLFLVVLLRSRLPKVATTANLNLIFDNLPDRWTLLGAALIVSSGLYFFHREQLKVHDS